MARPKATHVVCERHQAGCGTFTGTGFRRIIPITRASLQAGIVESGMPSAVLTTVVATEFDIEPSFVTGVVFLTTIISPLTLTPLLAYLGA